MLICPPPSGQAPAAQADGARVCVTARRCVWYYRRVRDRLRLTQQPAVSDRAPVVPAATCSRMHVLPVTHVRTPTDVDKSSAGGQAGDKEFAVVPMPVSYAVSHTLSHRSAQCNHQSVFVFVRRTASSVEHPNAKTYSKVFLELHIRLPSPFRCAFGAQNRENQNQHFELFECINLSLLLCITAHEKALV